jgi:hypothetical protein
MRALLPLLLLVACDAEQPTPVAPPVPAPEATPEQPAAPGPAAAEAGAAPPTVCPPIDGQATAMPSVQRIPLGERGLLVNTCPHPRGATAVSANLQGGDWSWKGEYVYEQPAGENEMWHDSFEAGGALGDGGHAVVHRYVTCDFDGCDRVGFYGVDPAGAVSVLATDTIATSWGLGPDGTFQYVERTGYSMGYHVASAAWTYTWKDGAFERQPEPVLKAEYERWPCPAGEVQPVNPESGEPEGAPISVSQGAPIQVLAVEPAQPGVLFEYKLGEFQFWAKDWTQTCAG